MAHGLRNLAFRCTRCGNCCRRFRVPVTGADIVRIQHATGLLPAAFVEWLSPDEVDMTGEPGSFVLLGVGRRLLVLAQRAGACAFLAANECSIHSAHPTSCSVYPFDVQYGKRGGIRRLKLLDLEGCEASWDGVTKARAVVADKQREEAELRAYQLRVSQFNRQQALRVRLGKQQLTAADFIDFLLRGANFERNSGSNTAESYGRESRIL